MMPKKIFSLLIVLLQLTFFACAQGPNSPMGNWNHMMGYGYGSWLSYGLVRFMSETIGSIDRTT